MKQKQLMIVSCAILFAGLVMSIVNAANDYGLRDINLCKEILSQNGTSGDDGETTSLDGVAVYDDHYMLKDVYKIIKKTNENGSVYIEGYTYNGLRPNTEYTFSIEEHRCEKDNLNVCVKDRQKTIIVNMYEGGGTTSGNTTNNG